MLTSKFGRREWRHWKAAAVEMLSGSNVSLHILLLTDNGSKLSVRGKGLASVSLSIVLGVYKDSRP
jgi:hypothetical protein